MEKYEKNVTKTELISTLFSWLICKDHDISLQIEIESGTNIHSY